MKYREITFNKEKIGRVIYDDGMVVFEDLPEDWEDLLFQGFYLHENEEGSEEELLIPDGDDPERYFKLLPLYGYEGLDFSGIKEE